MQGGGGGVITTVTRRRPVKRACNIHPPPPPCSRPSLSATRRGLAPETMGMGRARIGRAIFAVGHAVRDYFWRGLVEGEREGEGSISSAARPGMGGRVGPRWPLNLWITLPSFLTMMQIR